MWESVSTFLALRKWRDSRGSGVQGHQLLLSKFKTNLGYKRPCLKSPTNNFNYCKTVIYIILASSYNFKTERNLVDHLIWSLILASHPHPPKFKLSQAVTLDILGASDAVRVFSLYLHTYFPKVQRKLWTQESRTAACTTVYPYHFKLTFVTQITILWFFAVSVPLKAMCQSG